MTALAIDGPAGAGKSTVARAVAATLGWRYVDTGAMYRAVALAALEKGCDITDDDAMTALVSGLQIGVDGGKVALNGKDVSDRIRATDVTGAVAAVSALPGVRQALVGLQRELAGDGGVVMEGRDIGAAVLPWAPTKVYLTASLEQRALRRAKQLGLPTDDVTLEDLRASIAERDEADSSRAQSPLTRAPGAHVIDTSDMELEDVVERVRRVATGRDAS